MILTTTSLFFNPLVDVNNCKNSRSNGGTHVFLVKLIEKASFFTIKESSWMGLEMAKKHLKNRLKVVTPLFLTTTCLLFNALVDVNNCENCLGERGTLGFLVKLIEKGFVF